MNRCTAEGDRVRARIGKEEDILREGERAKGGSREMEKKCYKRNSTLNIQ